MSRVRERTDAMSAPDKAPHILPARGGNLGRHDRDRTAPRDAAHPGPDRRWPFACRALFPGRRQDHAAPRQSAVIENGFVFVPEEAPWLADCLSGLTTFPAGRHD